ncbi:hypothetical protein ASG32_29460 [Methylobacterium sp. Leaf361]|uniref:hypothetical protein n=1 Tax=unclassified Methylobacterium TaxID=2615210 RepID=UPI0006FF7865|nr:MULTISPECIES: hypothetical protein [unclassified Methylobacterium]KQS69319.1 hypothetical protein ASG32_29460 [Methylobacterium sp. Leaf361]SFT28286.1 hypothetical protein SAMN04487845_14429 [Methylobacterium sp. yr668]
MGERDKDDGRDFGLSPRDRDRLARERERKLRLLKRLGDAVGKPPEYFFEAVSENDATKNEPDDGSQR